MKTILSSIFNKPSHGLDIQDMSGQIDAINKVLGVIEFTPQGAVTRVNANFLKVVGYTENEVLGQHHRMFVDSTYAVSPSYQDFWDKLGRGEFDAGQYKRIAKGGKEVWLEASYNPILDKTGKVVKVVKYATDITANKLKEANFSGQLTAINKIQGVIEFDLTGKILDVNDNFAAVTGYSKSEIIGQHHSMFIEPAYRSSDEYKAFWAKLARGEADSGQYKRIARGGKHVWLQASYNPIFDMNGKPFKVVKYATDVTSDKLEKSNFEGQLASIGAIQAVIEFTLEGKILKANANFSKTMGYSEQEIIDQHHSMFVDPAEAAGEAYRNFWRDLATGKPNQGQFRRFAKGNKEVWLQGYYSPINDAEGKPYKVVKYASDITVMIQQQKQDQIKAAEAARVKTMLDSCSTNLMMADNDGIIIYMNPTCKSMMESNVNTFRKALPNFDLNKIIGHSFDQFHKNPGHQRNLLGSLKQSYETVVPVMDMFFRLKASPIMKPDGTRDGTSLEWIDITQERRSEVEISKIVEAASKGDLAQRLNIQDKVGATQKICEGINLLLENMSDVMQQVKEAGDTINTAASEISTGNNDLSQRTEQQASSLEETASSMEQLASTVKQNAENAKQANQLAAAASDVAVRGGQVVGEVVNTMVGIDESSRKIEDIISVIDGIAFQTNILALNAAVEAARAGEQGRGFAVVAGEVRNLAQRSASAAKEIKDLISDSVGKVQEGTKLVESAGNTMDEIVSSVKRVTDIMGEISAASIEQSSGIDQVNNAITSMDEVTQQNAALVEEAAAAAESLVEQAGGLMEIVGAFTLSASSQQSRASARLVPSPRPEIRAVSSKPAKVSVRSGTNDSEWEQF